MGWFRRKRARLLTPEELLAQGRKNATVASSSGVESSGDFRMMVDEVFFITGRGVVVLGTVAVGRLVVGSTVTGMRDGIPVGTHVVKAIETMRKRLTQANVGDEVAVLLAKAERGAFVSGDVLVIR